jgi:hypothetical protein
VTAGARISRNQKMAKATTVPEKIKVSSLNNSKPPHSMGRKGTVI